MVTRLTKNQMRTMGALALVACRILQEHEMYGEPDNPHNVYNRNIEALEKAFRSHGGLSIADLQDIKNATGVDEGSV